MLTINGRKIFTCRQAVSLLFALSVADQILLIMINGFFGSTVSKLFYVVEIGLFIIALPLILRTVRKGDVIAFFAWSMILSVNVLFLRREQGEYFSALIAVILKCFPIYFVGRAAGTQAEDVGKYLQWITVIAGIGYLMLSLKNGMDYGGYSYSQYIGYALLPPACIALCLSLKGKLWQIPFAMLLGYGVLASGARGPLFSLLLVAAVYVLGRMNRLTVKKTIGFAAVGLLVCVIISNMEAILTALLEVLSKNGLSVRVINTLLNGSFMESGDRIDTFVYSWNGALDHPFGIGIFHDRQFLLQQAGDAVASSAGYYPHNLFFEILLQFGIVFGSVLVVLLIIMLLKAYLNSRRNDAAMLCIAALFGSGLFPLMISASYVEWAPFYLMMGYIVTLAQKRKPDSLREIEDDTKAH